MLYFNGENFNDDVVDMDEDNKSKTITESDIDESPKEPDATLGDDTEVDEVEDEDEDE